MAQFLTVFTFAGISCFIALFLGWQKRGYQSAALTFNLGGVQIKSHTAEAMDTLITYRGRFPLTFGLMEFHELVVVVPERESETDPAIYAFKIRNHGGKHCTQEKQPDGSFTVWLPRWHNLFGLTIHYLEDTEELLLDMGCETPLNFFHSKTVFHRSLLKLAEEKKALTLLGPRQAEAGKVLFFPLAARKK